MKNLASKEDESDDEYEEEEIPVTCQFFDIGLGSSVAELYLHSEKDQLIGMTRSQMFFLQFDSDHQMQARIVFDSEKDLDSQGKLRKIVFDSSHQSVYSIFYQNKTPKIGVRLDLTSNEDMYYSHKIPEDVTSFAVDPQNPNKLWVVRENEIVALVLKERNFQLMEAEDLEKNLAVLVRGKGKVEGLTFGKKGEFYYVYEYNNIKKYSSAENHLISTLEGHAFEIEKLVFSKDMSYLFR